MRRRAFLAGIATVIATPFAAKAQQARKVWRIGFLGQGSLENHEPWLSALDDGLRDLGYVQGDNTVIERRYADAHSERLPRLAAELVRLNVDVLVAHGGAASDAKKATTTIPVIFIANPDPVGAGLVASLARPGGNLTGLSDLHSGLVAKRLELIKEVVPSASRVAVLSEATRPELALQLKDIQAVAPAVRMTILPVEVKGHDDIDRALGAVAKERPDVLNVLGTPLFATHRLRIADFALKRRIPTISTVKRFAEAGFLMSYGANFADLYRRAATYVDKILKRARPDDLPVEQPTRFELVINLKTAKALGLTIPPSAAGGSGHRLMRRRAFVSGALALLAAPAPVEAQEAKIWRIGFLSPYSAEFDKSWRAAFQQGLRDLGYVEGKNIVIEQRHADGRLERLPELAQELLRLKLDILLIHGGNPLAIHAARKVSDTIPIVMVANPDPVGTGVVSSLARPDGNVTGLSDLHSELAAKRLELLKEVVPLASRVAVLLNPASPAQRLQLKDIKAAAPASRMTIFSLEVSGPVEIDRAFTTIKRERLEALNVLGGAAGIHQRRVADLAVKTRIPTISTTRSFAHDGGLMSYGANFENLYRRAATYVDKILKGARPAELPIEQPTNFELVINLKTAKALGLTIPPSLLLRADQVIE